MLRLAVNEISGSGSQGCSQPYRTPSANRNADSLPEQDDGKIDWNAIAVHFPDRSNKDVRKRWCYTLEASINKGPWSEQEDATLQQGISSFGFRFVLLPFRVAASVTLTKLLEGGPKYLDLSKHVSPTVRISRDLFSLLGLTLCI